MSKVDKPSGAQRLRETPISAAEPEKKPAKSTAVPEGASSSFSVAELAYSLNTPNHQVQLAWDTRDELKLKLDTPSSPRERYLSEALASGVLSNERLTELSQVWFPDTLLLTAIQLAEALLTRPDTDLFAVLGRSPQVPSVVAITAPTVGASDKELGLGRAIVATWTQDTLKGRQSTNAQTLMDEMPGVNAAALGCLAEALDCGSARSFMQTVERAEPELVGQMLGFLRSQHRSRRTLARTAEQAPVDSDVLGLIEQLRSNPLSDSRFSSFAERSAQLMECVAGGEIDDHRQAALDDMQAALTQLEGVLAALQKQLGQPLFDRVVASLDVVNCLLPPEHLSVSTIASGEQPWPMSQRMDYAVERLQEAAVFAFADDFVAAIKEDKELGVLARSLDALSPTARTAAASEVLLSFIEVVPEGAASDYFASVVAAVKSSGVEAPISKLRADFQSDPTLQTEFIEFIADYATAEATEKSLQAGLHNQAERLAGKQLDIPLAGYKQLTAHMQRCHPYEGMGYLVSDGEQLMFVPVANVSDRPERSARPDPEDRAKVNQLVRSFGLTVVGTVHSHPDKSGVFSDEDLMAARPAVALAPGHRTIIAAVNEHKGSLTCSLASFSSDMSGQLIAEDHIGFA